MRRELEFLFIADAVAVLGPDKTKDRLLAIEALGYVLSEYTHSEIASFARTTRESVCRAMVAMGHRRGPRWRWRELAKQ